MDRIRERFWTLGGAFLLTGIAGYVNLISFKGLYHQAISHVTGNLTKLSMNVALGRGDDAISLFLIVSSFFLGSVLTGTVIDSTSLKPGRRYGVMMIFEGMILFLTTHLLNSESIYGEYLASMACGLQNAMATTYSGTILRTTHMTGVLTDLGILVGRTIRLRKFDGERYIIYVTLLSGFFLGGIVSLFSFSVLRYGALLIPGSILILTGLSYFSWRILNKN